MKLIYIRNTKKGEVQGATKAYQGKPNLVSGSRKAGLVGPGWVVSVGWSVAHTPKGCRFDSPSGHIPRLWV